MRTNIAEHHAFAVVLPTGDFLGAIQDKAHQVVFFVAAFQENNVTSLRIRIDKVCSVTYRGKGLQAVWAKWIVIRLALEARCAASGAGKNMRSCKIPGVLDLS